MSSLEPKMAPRARVSFDQLSNTAQILNVASDRLSKAIEDLDAALSMLNLGITSWVEFSSYGEGPFSEAEEIGYAKINGTWGIGLRKTFDDENDQSRSELTEWRFKDAPREMRLRAINNLGKLIERLNEDAGKAATTLENRIEEAEEYANAISLVADGVPGRKPRVADTKGGKR